MEIICINDNFDPIQIAIIPNRPIKDKIYSIRDVIKSQNGIGLLLNEIRNPKNGTSKINGMDFTFEPNFNVNRFTDLQGQPLDALEISRKIKTALV